MSNESKNPSQDEDKKHTNHQTTKTTNDKARAISNEEALRQAIKSSVHAKTRGFFN